MMQPSQGLICFSLISSPTQAIHWILARWISIPVCLTEKQLKGWDLGWLPLGYGITILEDQTRIMDGPDGEGRVLGSFESWKFFWPYRIGRLGSLGPAEFASL